MSGPTPYRAKQAGRAGGDERDDQLVQPAELAVEELGAAAELAQGLQGVVADHAAGPGPQRGKVRDQVRRTVAGEPGADVVGAGQDQGPGLVDRLGPLGPGGALGGH